MRFPLSILTASIIGFHILSGCSPISSDFSNAWAPSGLADVVYSKPEQWTQSSSLPLVLTAPEGDLNIAIVSIGEVATPEAAIATAWRQYRGSPIPDISLSIPLAAKDGWDQRHEFQFNTGASTPTVREAFSYRRQNSWTVVILDGSLRTLDIRSAAVDETLNSVRPNGVKVEDFSGKTPNALTPARISNLRKFVETSMEDLGIPGAAIALIQNDKIIYEEGLGIASLSTGEHVTKDTLFMVASNTKPMTTFLLASLVNEGKLEWDQPVRDVLPTFRLGTDEISDKVLVKHLICACTGLPRKDFGWIFGGSKDTPPSDTFDRLSVTTTSTGFGEVFQYSNLMAAAGGYVGGHALYPNLEFGDAYDKAMQTHVFVPLSMKDTTFSFEEALAKPHAAPHGLGLSGEIVEATLGLGYAIRPYRPAGGAWSSIHDMARFTVAELNAGLSVDGRQVVSREHVIARRDRITPSGNGAWYGMGLEELVRAGISVYNHGGSLPGYMSNYFFIPEANVGAVILTNSTTGSQLLNPFMHRLLEILYDGRREAVSAVKSAAARLKLQQASKRSDMTVPAAPSIAKRLASKYVSPEIGGIDVQIEKGVLIFDFGQWQSEMATRQNEDGTVSLLTISPTVDRFEFILEESAGRTTLKTREAQHEYFYHEQ